MLVFTCVVTAVRWMWFRTTAAECRLNTALSFCVVLCLLRERAFQEVVWISPLGRFLDSMLLFQISTALIVLAAGSLYLLASSWIGRSEHPFHACRVYAAALTSGVLMMILGTDARRAHLSMEEYPGWESLAYWAVFDVLPYWCAVSIVVVCIKELKRNPERREFLIYLTLAALFASIIVSNTMVLTASVFAAAGALNDFTAMQADADLVFIVFYTHVGAALAAVPVFIRVLELVHLDTWSRQRRALLPLWRDLTGACPEIVYLSDRRGATSSRSRFVLHRTIIEIRDCILILSRYATSEDAHRAQEAYPRIARSVLLAIAWRARIGGGEPSGDIEAQRSAARDLTEEVGELLTIASDWQVAKAAATRLILLSVTNAGTPARTGTR